jgi:Archaeal/vacuolar-type H+-ATPase subunit C
MAGSLLYVNARIKALENNMLNSVQLTRLAEAETLADAFKVLQECGYGNGLAIDDYKSYEHLIAEEERTAASFLRENLFKNSGLDAFLVKNDYHNAKVLMKAKYLRLDNVSDMVAPDGLMTLEDMRAKISDDDYSSLPKEMATALGAIDVAFADGNRSSRLIDVQLDGAMFKDIGARLKSAGQKPLLDYFTAWVDTTNIGSFVRSRAWGLEVGFFDEAYVSGGELDIEFYNALYAATDEQIKNKFKYTPYAELVLKAYDEDAGLVKYETAVDNYLLNVFKKSKYDMFSVAPIAGYYVGQLTEIKVVKLIISCIKNGVSRALLKQRLRELYA